MDRVTVSYGDTFDHSQGCHCNHRLLHHFTFFFDDDGVAACEDGRCRLPGVEEEGEGEREGEGFLSLFFGGGGLSPGTPSLLGSLFFVEPEISDHVTVTIADCHYSRLSLQSLSDIVTTLGRGQNRHNIQ